ncbi:hypothetical protein ABW02_16400 [Niallia circulans]|uniref:Uncharacterized protein n=1 Tax=Niallia circulans TaxID=1397 RepID=A0A0J1IGX4_NIACI|nr:hypothetical protein [Niallia circulans]KLV25166.1 hypothetical protein ABW02_16400 [Niallia circulans]
MFKSELVNLVLKFVCYALFMLFILFSVVDYWLKIAFVVLIIPLWVITDVIKYRKKKETMNFKIKNACYHWLIEQSDSTRSRGIFSNL